MTRRTQAVVAALQAALPQMTVREARKGDAHGRVDILDGPVLTIQDRGLKGFMLKLYVDDGDDITGLSDQIKLVAAKEPYALDDEGCELHLMFSKTDPMLDDSDYQVGADMSFTGVESRVVIAQETVRAA